MQLRTAVVEKKLQTVFYALGLLIGRRPWSVIASVIVLVALSSIGLLNFEQTNNAKTEFTPISAPSRDELAAVEKFLQQNGTLFLVNIMIQAKDGGSLLRPAVRHEALNIAREIQHEMTVTKNGREYGFSNMCEPYCGSNDPFIMFMKVYDTGLKKPTYPIMDNFGVRTFIGNNIYGVKLNNETNEVESYDTAILYYYMVVPKSDEDVVKKWEVEARRLTSSGKYDLLDAGLSSDNLLTEEVERMGTETAPLLVGAIVFMILFVVLTSLRYERSRSKPWEAMIGALIPIMANISAIGLMSACGLKFQSIVVCTLFLVQAVGCDGVFVMLRAWDVSKCHTDVVTRMAVTMKDAGPSITITSLTNALAFAVDIYSFTPAIQTFSIYSTAACVLCYIYQILLFSAVLALSGRREEKGMQAILCWRKADPKARYSALRWLKKFNADVIYRWSRIVTAWPTKIALVFVLLAYWYGALYGVLTMKTDLRVQKLALPNSYIVKYKDIHENAITAMQPLTIVVQQPGDLKNSTQLHRLKKLVRDYESTTFSYGSDSTFFWLSAYQEFLAFYADGDEEFFSYSEIPTFLKSASYSFWRAYLHINETACDNDQPDCVQQYIFNTGYHTVVKYTDMIPVLAEWRAIAANYSDLGVYAYTERALFTDQADQLADSIYTNVPMGLVCMVIVCIIFIPNVVSIVCAMLSVISISFGVFGYLSLSGVDLDPLSLAALLMSIGFSVDYTAHISYHYYKFTSKANPTERVEQTLKAIGWPTMQGGLATAFAMWPLLLKRSYLTTVFLKTVVLVVFLGLAHSMIVLPALLTCLDRFNCDKQGCKQNKSTPESINSSGSSSHTNISTICSSSTKNDSIS